MIEPSQLPPQEMSLHDYLAVVKRRRYTILKTMVVAAIAGFVFIATMRPVYQASARLLVRTVPGGMRDLSSGNPLADVMQMAEPISLETQIQTLEGSTFIDRAYRRSGILGRRYGSETPKVMVEGIQGTNLIDVTVTASDPKLAAGVANAMVDQYQEEMGAVGIEGVKRAREFVQQEAKKAQRELARYEHELLMFRHRHRIEEKTAEKEGRGQQLVALQTHVSEVESDVSGVQAQIRQLQQGLSREPVENLVPSYQTNPRVGALQSKIVELEMQRSSLLEEYRPTSRSVVSLDAQIARLRKQLAQEPAELHTFMHVDNPVREEMASRLKTLEADLRGLLASQARLSSQVADRREHMNQLDSWEIQLTQMTRARDAAEKSYSMLADKLQDLRIRENARRNTSQIVEHALIPFSSMPRHRPVNLALFLLLGLFSGFCLAFLQEYLDDSVTTPEEVGRRLGLPILGHIPLISGEGYRLMSQLPVYSPPAECYRSLRTNVSFAGVDATLRTVVVTSTHQGDGKSTTAVNLAIAMAMEARSVILVDADMRGPVVHRMLNVPVAPGLSEVLEDGLSLDQALCSTGVEGLLVLPSGSERKNPSELLNSAAMTRLIDDLKGQADIVIFDTPPCLPVTDAQVLAAKVEGVLLVAQMGKTTRAELEQARELFERVRSRIVGLVFNKMSKASGSYYYAYCQSYRRDGRDAEEGSHKHRNGMRALPWARSAAETHRTSKEES